MASERSALAGSASVEESARLIRNYRYAIERMMRALGGWIALTPELSAKLLMGRHVWDCAQHADLLGKRLPELRARAQASEPSSAAFLQFMDALEEPERPDQTVERLVGVYRVLKPHLLASYHEHLDRINSVYEPPTQRLLMRLAEDERRHIAAGHVVLAHLASSDAARLRANGWQARMRRVLEAAGGVAGAGVPAETDVSELPARPILNDDAREYIRLEQATGSWSIEPDLAAVITRVGDALAGSDPQAVRRWLAPDAVWDPEIHAGLARLEPRAHRVVAFAHVGGQRIVKIRLQGGSGAGTILARFVPTPDGWRAAVLDVAAVELTRPA